MTLRSYPKTIVVHDRFQEWEQKGFFKALWQAGVTEYDEVRGRAVNPITLCILIGIQGFLMTLIGITLGRALRTRLRIVKEWSELLSAFLLIGLGIWLLVTG